MKISDEEIEILALKRFPKQDVLLRNCSGVREIDKNSYVRRLWPESFKAAIKLM